MPDAETVRVGSRWKGITRYLTVVEVDGDRARLVFDDDPGDSFWEARQDVADYLTRIDGTRDE